MSGVGRSGLVGRPPKVPWIVGSICHSGAIKLFLVPANASHLASIRSVCVLVAHEGTAASFPCRYLFGSQPEVRRHITVNKMC